MKEAKPKRKYTKRTAAAPKPPAVTIDNLNHYRKHLNEMLYALTMEIHILTQIIDADIEKLTAAKK